jgi:hypothetical protein
MNNFPPEHRHRSQTMWSEALWSMVLIGVVMLLTLIATALGRL